jgi:acetolactate synthase-1/2/3 large subunit
MLFAEADVPDAPRYRAVRPAPSPADIDELKKLLAAAQRPIAIVGGGGWTRDALDRLRRWAEAASLPLTTSFRCQDYVDNRARVYAGDVAIGVNPKLAQHIKDADLILAIGARLGEITTGGYTLLEVPVPKQTLVHVHAGAEELGRVYAAKLPINSGMPQFVEALERVQLDGSRWHEWTRTGRADCEGWRAPIAMPGKVHLGEVVQWLSNNLPEDAIVANGAGNFATWLHRHFIYKGYRTQLGPTSGSMGYGFPAALAAKIAEPKRTVLAWVGDGEFLMTGQEFATAVQYDAPVVVCVVNNGMYGTIRMHQERSYPGRVSGTGLKNPDFAAYARAFGGHGEIVEETAQFAGAFERARSSGKPAIIELRIDPEAITPSATVSGLREAALKRATR